MDGRAIPSSLDAAERHAWSLLPEGEQTPGAGGRLMVFATRGLDDLPNARTLRLWRADPGQRLLWFHNDVRSPKHAELTRTPWALIVHYSPEADTQLRLHATVRMRRNDALALAAWNELPAETRRVFATAEPPGHAPAAQDAPPPLAGLADSKNSGYGNFEVLEAHVLHLDWLCLAGDGHRRAAFTWDADGTRHARWLYP